MTTIAGVSVWLEALGGSGEGLYDDPASLYDRDVFYDSGGGWTNLNSVLLRARLTRGGQARPGRIPSVRTGRLSADLYDPDRITDPIWAQFDFRPHTPVRLNSSAGVLWTGWADSWELDYISGEGRLVATDTAQLYDASQGTATRPRETSAQRMAAVLNRVPQAPAPVIDGTGLTLAPATVSGTVQAMADSVAESEGGLLWVGRDAALRFRSRGATYQKLSAQAAATLTDVEDPGSIRYDRFTARVDETLLVNEVLADRVRPVDHPPDPVVVTVEDSRARYGPSRVEVRDLHHDTDSDLHDWASMAVSLGAVPQPRPHDLHYRAWTGRAGAAAHLPAYLGLDIGDELTVKLTTRTPEQTWRMMLLAEDHDIRPDRWDITLTLTRLDPDDVADYDHVDAVYGSSVYAYRPLGG